jgi:hypothetical protein
MVLLGETEALGKKMCPSAAMPAINPAKYDLEAKQALVVRPRPSEPANLIVRPYAHECSYSVNSDAIASLCLVGYSTKKAVNGIFR